LSRRFDGVIFDMDGTLIEQRLDFAAIRAELGISPRDGILEAIEQMPSGDAARASRDLLAREMAAARSARLIPGAQEIIERIRGAGMKSALLTRNARPVMEMIMERFDLSFDLAWSREDGPIKPAPDGILRACRRLGIAPPRACCVGDFHYDVQAANAAGATSVLLARQEHSQFADEADYVIRDLGELANILGA